MADAFLLSLLRAAEAGETCPPIRLVTGAGDLIVGQPAPSGSFIQSMQRPLADEYEAALRRRPRRQQREDPQNPEALARDALSLLGAADGGEAALTLVNAEIIWSGREDGRWIPALRVPVSAVHAWWVAGGKEVRGGSSGAGWAVGGFVSE